MFRRLKVTLCAMVLALAAMPASADAGASSFWQCAPFARMFSGVQLFGAAASWWNQAIGKYSRGDTPKAGAVLVFKAIGSMRSGHVATVSQVVSDRIIRVTHANWSIPGRIERDVEVMDVSAKNDWSRVRVWFRDIHGLGNSSYPVYGFIYGGGHGDGAKPDAAEAPRPAAVRPAALQVEADKDLRAKRARAPLAALVG